MRTLVFERALLPDGWAEEVAVTIDDAGDIETVTAGGQHGERVRGCMLPGVPNLHCHAHQRAMAGLAERSGDDHVNDSFWTWRQVMYHFLERIEPHHLEAIAAQLYLEMLKAGYTSVAEFQYLHHDPHGVPYADRAEMSHATLAAAQSVGIAITALPVLYGFSGFGATPPMPGQRRFINDADGFLRIVESLRAATAGDPNLAVGIAPHSLRAVSKALLTEVLGTRDDGPVHVHIAEQRKEVADCVDWSGQRPVEWLLANFDVHGAWCLVHATHMTASETTAMAQSGAVAGLTPTTEANLGDGLFNAPEFLLAGGAIGIGSDSNISVSPVEEMRWLEYGQRLSRFARNVLSGGPGRSTGRSLYERCLSGGSRACGRRTGRIERGHRADMIVIETDHPQLYGRHGDALLDGWIFSGNTNLVRDVYVGGKRLVHNGRHCNEADVRSRFALSMAELMS